MTEAVAMGNGRAPEECADAVVVGSRCAGSAAASMLADAGRSVIVLDRASFPSDTLSTHAMFPAGCAEFRRVGALDKIHSRLDPPRITFARLTITGEAELRERFEPVEGIDYGVSLPRNLVDVLLVEAARDRGADVRESSALQEVLWDRGRVCGVAYTDASGTRRRVRSEVVIGADGRRSTVAARVGAWRPYRISKNGRGMVFRYMDDPTHDPDHRHTMWMWRDGESIAFVFPTPGGRMITLFMGSASEVAEARSDPEDYWRRKLGEHPGVAERIAGCANETKPRSTADIQAFWRRASGPGWVLAGDANHFKDPVTGQGMGDALRMGRTLGERLAPLLGDHAATDSEARRWEQDTIDHCLWAYHFANNDAKVRPTAPHYTEAIREFGRNEAPQLAHVLGRTRTTQEIVTPAVMARSVVRALRRGPDRRAILRNALADTATQHRVQRELRRRELRPLGPVPGSDRPGGTWPPAPRAPAREQDEPPKTPQPEPAAP
jgi:flavin-dependent dehydrogenase